MAGDISGKPELVWAQKRDHNGNPQWVRDAHGRIAKDDDGKRIPVMHRIRRFTGTEGILGYLMFLAQEEPKIYAQLLARILPHNIRVDGGIDLRGDRAATPAELADALRQKGLPVELLAEEMLKDDPATKLRLVNPDRKRQPVRVPNARNGVRHDHGNDVGDADDDARMDVDADADADDDFGDDNRYR